MNKLRRAVQWFRRELKIGLGPALSTVFICASIIMQGARINELQRENNQQSEWILKLAQAMAAQQQIDHAQWPSSPCLAERNTRQVVLTNPNREYEGSLRH